MRPPKLVVVAAAQEASALCSQRWLRFFEQNFYVDKWNSYRGLGAARVSLQADPRCARYAATQRGSEA